MVEIPAIAFLAIMSNDLTNAVYQDASVTLIQVAQGICLSLFAALASFTFVEDRSFGSSAKVMLKQKLQVFQAYDFGGMKKTA